MIWVASDWFILTHAMVIHGANSNLHSYSGPEAGNVHDMYVNEVTEGEVRGRRVNVKRQT